MSEQPQPQNPNQSMTLAKSGQVSVQRYGDDRQIQMEIKALKLGLPNMSKQPDAAVAALLIASKQSGLNPYRGEIYYTDKGVVVASKVKAADAITAAAKRGDSLDIKFYPFTPNHALWEELREPDLDENDCAFLCEITSSRARREWYVEKIARIDELKALGYKREEIEPKIKDEFPAPPVYRAVGIVKAAERFGDEQKKFVAFTRSDRAKKRALTKCLNANGLSAPDQRTYGAVPIAEEVEAAEGGFTVQTPADVQAQIDPEFAAAMEGEMVEETTADATSTEPEQRLSRDNRGDGDSPFGMDDAPAQTPTGQPTPDLITPRVKKLIDDKARVYADNGRGADEKQVKLVFLLLKEISGGDDAKRHTLQVKLTGFEKFNDIPGPYALALIDWMKPTQNGDKKYHADPQAIREAEAIVREALLAAGQQPLM